MENKKQNSRRKFIKSAGKVVVVAPAAGLILNAANAQAQVPIASGRIDPCGITQMCED